MLAQLTRLQTYVDFASPFVDLEERLAEEPAADAKLCQLHISRCRCVKRQNPRRVKIHRCYTVEEVAKLFAAHKNTVRDWLKAGLPKIDDRKPILILGRQLAGFLHMRRARRQRRCRAGEFYCFRCRAPKRAAACAAEYLPITARSGNLRATCVDCGTRMFRRVSFHKLAVVADLHVVLPQAQQRLTECADPSLNCALEREPDAQPGE
jgi:hypothetical protein